MELIKNKSLDEIFIFFNFKEFYAFLTELNSLGKISKNDTPICFNLNIDEPCSSTNTESKFKYIIHWYMRKESYSVVSYDMNFNHKLIEALEQNKLVSDIEMYMKLK